MAVDKGDPRQPEMRAGQLRTDLESLGDLPGGDQVRASLSPATIQQIQQSGGTKWLPLALDIELAEAVSRSLGEGATRDWSRRSMIKGADGPLLRPIVQATIKVFGLQAAGLLRFAPRIWPSLFRNCGELVVTCSDQCLQLTLINAPEIIVRSRPFLLSLAGAFDGVITLCKGKGRAEIASAGDGRVVFEVAAS